MQEGRKPRVAIAENDEVLAFLLSEICQLAGYEVAGRAADAFGAAALVAATHPDVLIADFALDGAQDGLELIHALENQNPGIVTILITGWDLTVISTRLDLVRPDHILQKPVLPRQIVPVLESTVANMKRCLDVPMARAA